MRRVLVALLSLATLLSLGASPASARLTASFSLRAFEGAREAVVATIQDVKVVGQRQLGNQRVETLRIGARVELTFKGGQRGKRLSFVHWRAKLTGPTFNGFRYPTLVKGRAYLLVLERKGKDLQLIAPEDDIVDVPPRVLRAAIKQHTQRGLAKLVALLRLRVLFCAGSCGRAIWLLEQAPRAHIAEKKLVALLLPVARSNGSDANSKLAAYSVLGKLGQAAVIPEIVAYCSGKVGRSDARANALSWLQGFTKAQQIAALEQILARTHDASVQSAARYRLGFLTRTR